MQEVQQEKAYFAHHPRLWREFHYVYPVVSRRSKGLSIGINLNVDKVCNFDCIYCCVDRTVPPVRRDIDLAQIGRELEALLAWVAAGDIWRAAEFAAVPAALRVLRDITFSGDGEPTSCPKFADACRLAAESRRRHGLRDVKLIVHTDSSLLHRAGVKRGLAVLDANHGEVWAKLDAGTAAYYRLVNRTAVPFQRILDNLLETGRERAIVIQSLFMTVDGVPLPDREFEAYAGRLAALLDGGCRVSLVQLYTVARRTAEKTAGPLSRAHLDRLAAALAVRFPAVPCEAYYGIG